MQSCLAGIWDNDVLENVLSWWQSGKENPEVPGLPAVSELDLLGSTEKVVSRYEMTGTIEPGLMRICRWAARRKIHWHDGVLPGPEATIHAGELAAELAWSCFVHLFDTIGFLHSSYALLPAGILEEIRDGQFSVSVEPEIYFEKARTVQRALFRAMEQDFFKVFPKTNLPLPKIWEQVLTQPCYQNLDSFLKRFRMSEMWYSLAQSGTKRLLWDEFLTGMELDEDFEGTTTSEEDVYQVFLDLIQTMVLPARFPKGTQKLENWLESMANWPQPWTEMLADLQVYEVCPHLKKQEAGRFDHRLLEALQEAACTASNLPAGNRVLYHYVNDLFDNTILDAMVAGYQFHASVDAIDSEPDLIRACRKYSSELTNFYEALKRAGASIKKGSVLSDTELARLRGRLILHFLKWLENREQG